MSKDGAREYFLRPSCCHQVAIAFDGKFRRVGRGANKNGALFLPSVIDAAGDRFGVPMTVVGELYFAVEASRSRTENGKPS